jgi:hypothetical protein
MSCKKKWVPTPKKRGRKQIKTNRPTRNNFMSSNIDTFELKQIKNLVIPVKSLYKHEREDWHPEEKLGEGKDSSVRFEWGESVYIDGLVIDGSLYVKSIELSGECSGTAIDWIIEPALKDGTGTLVASCVWVCGDINQLQVNDGNIEWVDIKI